MSVMYATAADLASYLQQDLDTASATLTLQVASALFSQRADTWWAPQTVTFTTQARGAVLRLPFSPVTSITSVKVTTAAGVTTTLTDYTRVGSTLYRSGGFGSWGAFPPDTVEVVLVHGYATATDDVKGAVLETAGAAYQSPDVTVKSESIDDYSVSSAANAGGVSLTPSAVALADFYRGTLVA